MTIPESILTDEFAARLERRPEDILEEVRRGDLSVEQARADYAVVLTGRPNDPDFALDLEATEELRAQIELAAAPHGGA